MDDRVFPLLLLLLLLRDTDDDELRDDELLLLTPLLRDDELLLLTPLLRDDERVVLLPLRTVSELSDVFELLRFTLDERVDERPETPEPDVLLSEFRREELRELRPEP